MGGVWLVTLRFPPTGVPAPEVVRVGEAEDLAGLLARVRAGEAALPGWPLAAAREVPADADPVAWLLARTEASVGAAASAGLVQCAHEAADGGLVARYLFDAAYARAHPEALDPEHLGLLHGTLLAKVLDDGAVILPREALWASLRWRGAQARGTRLSRDGRRG